MHMHMKMQGCTEYTGLCYFCYPSSAFCHETSKCDNVCVAPALIKVVLSVSSIGCNNERQSFAKLSYSAIDSVLTNLLPIGIFPSSWGSICVTRKLSAK